MVFNPILQGIQRGHPVRILRTAIALAIAFTAAVNATALSSRPSQKPDVLLITIDDLNDWISLLDERAPIQTPNLERLARRGMLFNRAYCISAACNPSRAATMTGLRPSTTGVYGNRSDWRKAVGNRKTIMQRFMDAGYDVRGAGKIFHHHMNGAFHDKASFHHFQPMRPQLYPPKKLNEAPRYGSRNTDWGAWPKRDQDSIDHHTAEYCIKALLERKVNLPQFLSCGIFKPHSPFFAPSLYHKKYEKINLPERNKDDWNDLPQGAVKLMRSKKWFWNGMMQLESKTAGSYQRFVNSYAACVSFADTQIGRVLDALDKAPRSKNTIVVLWSDHGFHLGEKDHIEKFALWEKSNHVPFIIVAPGITDPERVCGKPVDLTVLYPTLLELCSLKADREVDGVSVVPLLRKPKAKWERPALMTYGRGNHAIRSERWRYISYADGSEELYDHQSDPEEWTNLITKPSLKEVITSHRKWLPKKEALPIADLGKKR